MEVRVNQCENYSNSTTRVETNSSSESEALSDSEKN
jgi:hypothetical protein